jgi:hypothetical protein
MVIACHRLVARRVRRRTTETTEMNPRTNAQQQAPVAADARLAAAMNAFGHGCQVDATTGTAMAAWSSNAKRFTSYAAMKRPARHLGSPTT